MQSKTPIFYIEAISPCPNKVDHAKESVSLPSYSRALHTEDCSHVSLAPSLLQAEQPLLSQPVLIGEVFHPWDHYCGPSLDAFQQVYVSLHINICRK